MNKRQMMLMIRSFEEQVALDPDIRGVMHRCIGQEACAVGVLANSKGGDFCFSNHRGHGHALAWGISPGELWDELRRGEGGSQHIVRENFITGGIQGGMTPIACGVAWGMKRKGTDNIVFCFIGDGTLGQGILYEALGMAWLWKLPVLFIVENNGWAMSTRTDATYMVERFESYGIEAKKMKANNVNRVYKRARTMVDYVRTGKPGVLILDTYRLCPHGKSDEIRSEDEIEAHRHLDPLRNGGRYGYAKDWQRIKSLVTGYALKGRRNNPSR